MKSKDCPKCRLKAGPCAYCGTSGTIPLCPPVGEPVVYHADKGFQPMIVSASERVAGGDGQATVLVNGWIFARNFGATCVSPFLLEGVRGPSSDKGHWNWRGDPS